MSNIKIGIQTRSLRQPLKQSLRVASRLGADGVEIDARTELPHSELSQTGLREFRKLLDDLRLRISVVSFPTRRGYEVAEDLERRVFATQAAMRFARSLGADVVVVRAGQFQDDPNDSRRARLIESLTALGAFGEHVGVRLAAQTNGEDPQHLARLIAVLPKQTVGVDLHPSRLILAGHAPAEAVELLGEHVLHVHACDAVRESGQAGREVELGRGAADFPELLGRLSEFDYRGWITIERRETAEPVSEMENAVAFLRHLK